MQRNDGFKICFGGDFPGGSVAMTLYSQCREPVFNPRSGNYRLPHATIKTQYSRINVLFFFLKLYLGDKNQQDSSHD